MPTVRQKIVANAKWGVDNASQIHYSQGSLRMEGVHKSFKLPLTADCSAFVTDCYAWAGAPDPNQMGYNGFGYTGTLLAHGEHIPVSDVTPGDVVVYGGGTGEHTAIVVAVYNKVDVLTVSHGWEGDPSYVWVNMPRTVTTKGYGIDGRLPQTFLRFIPKDPVIIPNGSLPPSKPQVVAAIGGKPRKVLKFKNTQQIKQWQAAHGLDADGIIGPLTTAKLRALGLM
jgi:hypothetical protein